MRYEEMPDLISLYELCYRNGITSYEIPIDNKSILIVVVEKQKIKFIIESKADFSQRAMLFEIFEKENSERHINIIIEVPNMNHIQGIEINDESYKKSIEDFCNSLINKLRKEIDEASVDCTKSIIGCLISARGNI